MLKFCQILLRKIHPNGVVNATPDNCAKAEILWIVKSQQMMERDKNFSQWRRQLGLFQDENQIWRCRGRIQNAEVPFSTMHPILLDRNHFLSILAVRRAHERVMHGDVKATLTELRSQFWILKGRSFVEQLTFWHEHKLTHNINTTIQSNI